jgi:putative membrane protein
MIIPVATTEEMQRIVALALPSLDTTSSPMILDALEKSHEEWVETHPQLTHTLGSPTRARYRIPVSASVNGVALHHGVLFLRTGQWIKRLSLVPLARVQSVAIGVGPWHELLDMGFFRVHSVSGPVNTTAPAFDYSQLEAWWTSLTEEALSAIAAYRPKVRARTTRNLS